MPLPQGDLWGVPDVAFLKGAAILGVLSVVIAAVVSFRLRRGHPPTRELHPYEVAYLTGGGRHTIAAVLLSLRLDGAIRADQPGGDLHVSGERRSADTPLDEVVHEAVRSRQARTVAAVTAHETVQEAIKSLRDGLAAQGMVLDERRRRLARRAAWPLWLVIVVSGVRLAWYLADSKLFDGPDVPFTGILIIPMVVALLFLYAMTSGHAEKTRAVKAALKDTRQRHGHLDPRVFPAWPTYGIPASAMGVALFGTAALMSIDPTFSQAAGLGRLLQMAGSASSSGGIGYSGSSCSSTASVCSSSGCSGGSGGDGGGGSSCGGGGGSSCGGCGGG
ncbi:TIGR04222 domain-containing membrane protein [Actinomadura miaoliensis]|uniref:TIGR04222 domain-containing membrane protein n=1 Tax=Actinomadura miaoliensis TaxID=430685 RepID=A0ABP7X639_9ACTN